MMFAPFSEYQSYKKITLTWSSEMISFEFTPHKAVDKITINVSTKKKREK